MEETLSVPALSQGERVLDTFLAPSKTFTDILRSASWWLPFLILFVVTVVSSFAVDKKVGFDAVAQQQMTKNKSSAEAMEQLPPDQRAKRIQMSAMITRGISYASFVPILIVVAIEAAVLLACFNFILGAKVTYGQTFAVIMYAGLPRIFIAILTAVLLFSGVSTDGFDQTNPVGTNLGYYVDSPYSKPRAASSMSSASGRLRCSRSAWRSLRARRLASPPPSSWAGGSSFCSSSPASRPLPARARQVTG